MPGFVYLKDGTSNKVPQFFSHGAEIAALSNCKTNSGENAKQALGRADPDR